MCPPHGIVKRSNKKNLSLKELSIKRRNVWDICVCFNPLGPIGYGWFSYPPIGNFLFDGLIRPIRACA